MIAEVISIGDELTSGQRLDTNSQWLSQQLGDLGIRVVYHTTVADDLAANVGVFAQARERADLIVCTGGLGPTADDLTRDVLAQTAGVDLVLDEPSLAHIQQMFARRQRPMPPSNQLQAMLPRGARVIPNPHGTAPGIDMDLPRVPRSSDTIAASARPPARIFCLPGVPAEMREMWHASVVPLIEQAAGARRRMLRHFPVKCFGVGESDLEQMLPDLIRRGRDPQVGITASHAMLTLRITASGGTPAECEALARPTIEIIRQCLGSLVVSEADEDLHEVVARMLRVAYKTLATVEIGTPGLLAHWLSAIPDAASWHRGSLTLSPETVPREWRSSNWSRQTAEEQTVALAERVRTWFGSDYALAIGPAPTSASLGESAPTIAIALAQGSGTSLHLLPYTGHPNILSTRTAKHALNDLRLALRE